MSNQTRKAILQEYKSHSIENAWLRYRLSIDGKDLKNMVCQINRGEAIKTGRLKKRRLRYDVRVKCKKGATQIIPVVYCPSLKAIVTILPEKHIRTRPVQENCLAIGVKELKTAALKIRRGDGCCLKQGRHGLTEWLVTINEEVMRFVYDENTQRVAVPYN